MHKVVWFSVLTMVAANVAAQVPPGSVVYAHRSAPVQMLYGSGITVVDPVLGTYRSVTGLPPGLLQGNGTEPAGVGCVLVRDSDGELFAATASPSPGEPFCIYQLTLDAGLAVQQVRAYPIGVATTATSVSQMDWLVDGRIVYAHSGLLSLPPGVRILDPATGVDVAMPWPQIPRIQPSAVAASRTEAKLYVGVNDPTGAVWQVDLLAIAATQVAAFPRGVTGLAVNHRSDQVYASLDQYGVYHADLTRQPPHVRPLTTAANVQGICVDRVSGRLCVATATVFGGNYQWVDPLSRVWRPLPGAYPAESPSDVSCRATLIAFGSESAPTIDSSWQIEGNPGGVPMPGNLAFSISMQTTPPGLGGVLLLGNRSTRPLQVSVPEVHNILVDPGGFFAYAVVPAVAGIGGPTQPPATGTTIPLPIPAAVSRGVFFAQVLHVDNGAFFGSPGLAIHVG